MGDIIDFLSAVWGDLGSWFGEIRVIHDGSVYSYFCTTLEEAQAKAISHDNLGHDVYYGVQPRTMRRGRAQDTRQYGDVLWLDLDGKSYGGGKQEAFVRLSQLSPVPQIIVDSGHGYHAYWLMNAPWPFEDLQQTMIAMEGASLADHCSDAPRVLRLPGTHNHKYGERTPVRLLRFDMMGRRHRLVDFADYLDRQRMAEEQLLSEDVFQQNGDTDGWTPSRDGVGKFPEGTRNNSLARLAGIMIARGLGYDEMLVQLGHENQVRCEPPLPDQEVVAIVRSVQRYR